LSTDPTPSRRLLVSVDMQKYSRQDNLGQYAAQQTFQRVIAEAVRAAGLDRSGWLTQAGGDSELAILPPEVPEERVVGQFTRHLDQLLRDANRRLLPAAKVRLRMAVHEGRVHLDGANGYPGDAINTVCRLRDARCLKQALERFPNAGLALIVSDPIYRDVVAQGYDGIREERFRRVTVNTAEKGFRMEAWMSVLDEDVTGIDLDEDAADGPTAPPAAPAKTRHDGSTYDIGRIDNKGQLAIGDNAGAYGFIRPEEMP
jgi:hypothetical protein